MTRMNRNTFLSDLKDKRKFDVVVAALCAWRTIRCLKYRTIISYAANLFMKIFSLSWVFMNIVAVTGI